MIVAQRLVSRELLVAKERRVSYRVCFPSMRMFLFVSGIVGCSEHVRPPRTVPVTGTVMVNGKPAAGIRVTMHAQFSMGRHQWLVIGETGPTGEFIARTGLGNEGAPPGEYVVTFIKPRVTSDPKLNGLEVEVDDFEGKYSDPETSDVTVVVERGNNVL